MALEPVGCILLGSGVDLSVSQSQDRRVCVSPAPWHRGAVGLHPAAAPLSGEKGCGGDARACLGTWGPSPWPPLRARGVSCWVRPSYRRCRGRGRARRPPAAGPGGAAPGPWAQCPVLPPAASGGGEEREKRGRRGKKGGDATPRPPSGDSLSPQPALSDPNARTAGIWGQKGGAFSSGVPPPQHPRRFWGAPNPSPAPVPPPPAGSRDTAPASSRPRGEGRGVPARRAPPQFLLAPYLEQAKIPRGEASGPDDHGARGGSRIRPRGPSETSGERGAAVSSDQRPLLPQAHTAQRGGGHRGVSGGTGAGLGSGRARC